MSLVLILYFGNITFSVRYGTAHLGLGSFEDKGLCHKGGNVDQTCVAAQVAGECLNTSALLKQLIEEK